MSADVDIDFANREDILQYIKNIPARKLHKGTPERHNSGVYVQPILTTRCWMHPHCILKKQTNAGTLK